MFNFSAFRFDSPMSPEMVLEELIRRKGTSGSIPLDPEFEIQNKVRSDRSQFKALLCTRRSGKSTTEVLDHIDKCMEFPNSRTLYMALTLDSASEICWDIFKEYNERYNLGMRFNESKKIVFYPNGSRTRLFGLDSNEKQITRVLGQKLRKVSIDEAGSLTRNMKKIVYQMILPALADLSPNSWMTLLGTCENIPNTFFEEVTEGRETTVPWQVYKWTAYENPYMKKQWGELIDNMTASNPDVKEASWFKTHYLNMWVSDDNLLIIPVSKATKVKSLPDAKDWIHILGVDLGFNDASAFSIVSFSFHHMKAYVTESFNESGMDFTDVAETIKRLKSKYNISRIVVDGANKQGVEQMKKRLGLPELETAEKQGKPVYLKLLRDDIVTGRLCLVEEMNTELELEWSSLQWKDLKKLFEDPRCANHTSDATLYAWRETHAYMAMEPVAKPDPTKPEYNEYLEKYYQEQDTESEDFAYGTTDSNSDW